MATSKGGYVSGGFDILKAPNAPTITSVATNIGSATVAFTAPADVGGGAITSYTITAVDESTGASTGAVGTASPITISPGGGTFKIRAAATNIYGPGRVSQYDTGNQIYSGASLWGWGDNTDGSIGDNTTIRRSSPVQIGSLGTWKQVTSGKSNAASIKTDGSLWAWGFNGSGELGQGNAISRSSPVQVGALTNWAQISVGSSFCLSVKTDGTLWSWGDNFVGQLGDNTRTNRSSPVQVGALTNWSQASAGYALSVSVKTDGTLWTWGRGESGQLGIGFGGIGIYRSSPVQVGALTDWVQVSAGRDSVASVKSNGTLWAWGYNGSGQLGDNTRINRSSPVQIGTLTNWAQASASNFNTSFTSATKKDGTLWSWGSNTQGQLGQNNTINRSSPVQIGALTNWAQVAAGSRHTASIKTDGTLWTWGHNTDGQLGDGTVVTKSSPVQVGSLTNWSQVSAGYSRTAALYGVV